MINVSMLEITLTQSQITTAGSGATPGGFQSLLTQTMNAKATHFKTDAVDKGGETTQTGGGLAALLAILQQNNPTPCSNCRQPENSANLPSQTAWDHPLPGKNAPYKKEDEDNTLQGLWAILFDLLDQTSALVSELYDLVPEDAPVSKLPSRQEPVTPPTAAALPLAA
ncbi:MAG: hypothetical protein HW380_2023 [Magnetococcales bacterium]|nr:hypothetical protein [Magnetococcales bacterium]HIJ84836.1 hypothetical protein [Magnetococcales bacterium]